MNSRAKGKRGELEWAAALRDLGFVEARRGQQFNGLGGEDVVDGIPGTHCEVKRTEKLRLQEAIDQAVRDAGPAVPYVAHRRNRSEWLVIVRARDLLNLARLLYDRQP